MRPAQHLHFLYPVARECRGNVRSPGAMSVLRGNVRSPGAMSIPRGNVRSQGAMSVHRGNVHSTVYWGGQPNSSTVDVNGVTVIFAPPPANIRYGLTVLIHNSGQIFNIVLFMVSYILITGYSVLLFTNPLNFKFLQVPAVLFYT